MKLLKILALLLLSTLPASAQTIHVEAEKFTSASPIPLIQTTGDIAAPAIGSQKIVLAAGGKYDYSITVATAGTYSLTVRLDGPTSVHFELPVGTNTSGSIPAISTAWTTYTAPNKITLSAGMQTIRMVADTAAAPPQYPAANWFELTYVPPPNINLTTTGSILFDDKTPAAFGVGIDIQQSDNNNGWVNAGTVTSDASGNLSGNFIVNPNLATSAGFVTFQFSINGIGSTVDFSFPVQEFQQGSTGLNLSLVLFKSVLLPKSFGTELLP